MWRIKKFQGDFETILRCNALISSIDKSWVRPPLTLEF